MSMRVFLVKLIDNDNELRPRMKDKDAEVEQLKTELISQKEESKDCVSISDPVYAIAVKLN